MRKLVFHGAWLSAMIAITGCISLQDNALFDTVPKDENVMFHLSEEIYSDYFTSEGWVAPNDGCLTVEPSTLAVKEGELGLHITWNKTAQECPWLGMGFGWDNWTGKDLQSIKNTGALQFYVRAPKGGRKVLPWAIGFEDFNGSQAWLGMSSNAIKAEGVSEEWTRVEMPLSEFNWEEQDADASNIKQIIFQFEADGEVYLDEIKLVPYTGGYRKRAQVEWSSNSASKADGDYSDPIWKGKPITFEENIIYIRVEGSNLVVAGRIKDESPLVNLQEGSELYNGDAIELAFSTSDQSAVRRTLFMSTDQHLIIGMKPNDAQVYDFRKDKAIEGATVHTSATSTGYTFEAVIPLDGISKVLSVGHLYGLEVAVDQAAGEVRSVQQRWNNAAVDGFYQNPSLWGEMIIQSSTSKAN